MNKVLILGGTRFFGKKLVEALLRKGADVTIATRGKTADPFGNAVKRIEVDRTDSAAFKSAIGTAQWDVVYDNICFTPQEADEACAIFAGKVQRYILTSSLSVYEFGPERRSESDFNPYTHPIQLEVQPELSYKEGKRCAEAVLLQKASFPVCAVRFPIVLGADDYTKRLHFHVEHVRQDEPIGIPSLDAKLSFISSDEAAEFLAWLKDNAMEGPVNACSTGELSLRDIVTAVEAAVGKQARVVVDMSELPDVHKSPFGAPDSWFMDTAKAKQHGFAFRNVRDWFVPLVRDIAAGRA
ncbi:NAD-dependent epimerase/dehydratase family protein [Paenibacillus apiarius]|uniref:NAD-dependent epimerase/dehydratase family protein n=1 Tax=Paenibacillus apiarius TaxID=46240 RepID=UPI00197DBD86|nr:NAD-dependent epimerase/dehydratase family protein [Paenibacillus apiarius]MBN3526750.1 NAD-dependent epimerase/dehydratase family protein [Paenibacillus apiarius]